LKFHLANLGLGPLKEDMMQPYKEICMSISNVKYRTCLRHLVGTCLFAVQGEKIGKLLKKQQKLSKLLW